MRVYLLCASTSDGAVMSERLDRLCAAGDIGELVAYYRGLPLYPDQPRYALRAAEGIRSNMRAVFEAVAHRNPYPAEQLNEPAWNQLVLKALFVGIPLHPIVGLDGRRNPTLARMLCDYAHERWAASRPVSPELWRCVGPFAAGPVLDDFARLFERGTADEQKAAALALREATDPGRGTPARVAVRGAVDSPDAILIWEAARGSGHLRTSTRRVSMRFIDPHIHMSARTTDDYERMAAAGIVAVIEPAFWLGQPRTQVGTFIDYLSSLVGWERFRASQFGIRHYCTIGLNSKEANNEALAEQVMDILPLYLGKEGVVAVGEIGYDDQTAAEDKYYRAQLQLARDLGMLVQVHTPHRDKKRGTSRSMDVAIEMGLDPASVSHRSQQRRDGPGSARPRLLGRLHAVSGDQDGQRAHGGDRAPLRLDAHLHRLERRLGQVGSARGAQDGAADARARHPSCRRRSHLLHERARGIRPKRPDQGRSTG